MVSGAAFAEPVDLPARLPDGRILNLWCDGKTGSAVVLDSGWAGDSRAWKRVMEGLAGEFRVCAQDRAGSGASDAGPLPRDGAAISRDLHQALAAAEVKGPYILVGHSIGALNIRSFAQMYPADVAGLVLVDPATPVPGRPYAVGQINRSRICLADALAHQMDKTAEPRPENCRATPQEKAVIRWEARLSELESLSTSTIAALEDQQMGSLSMPLIVLSAGATPEPVASTLARQQQHRELATLSRNGAVEIVADSGHMMIFDRPDAIVAAVRSVSRAAGKSKQPWNKRKSVSHIVSD